MITAWHAILHWLGIDYGLPYGHWGFYSFWSGVAGSFLIGAVVWLAVWYPHHTCHVKGCWRMRRAPVAGTAWSTCWRHHPEGRPTHAHIIAQHREHKARAGPVTAQIPPPDGGQI